MDGTDGKTDWPLQPDGTHPLTELYLADYQVVDVAKPYAQDSYLEIEQALLQGRADATCGGRSLNDDAGDTNLTFVVTGGNGPRISDGVDQATVRASDSFPYQAVADVDTFFAQEIPAVREWSFGRETAARVTQPALAVLGARTKEVTSVFDRRRSRSPQPSTGIGSRSGL